MNGQAWAFLVLVANQLLATVVFIVMYVRQSDWRRSTIGRHLLYWTAAAGAVDVSWLLLLGVRRSWLVYLLLAVQAAVGVLAWRRVWLVWQAQRPES